MKTKTKTKTILRILCGADGSTTPHDGRYVVFWNPHTEAGVLELISTPDPAEAHVFTRAAAVTEWRTVSCVQPRRPWDGLPNRPLTSITIELLPAGAV